MATYKDYKISVYDDFFTKEDTWKAIASFVPEDKKIYMPFYSPYSNCNILLGKHIKNEIIYEDRDFFSYTITDGIVCDNPPFSKKKLILEKLLVDNVPFMLILPVSTMCYKYFNKFKNSKIQLIIFNGRQGFNKCNPETGIVKDDVKSNPAFDCVVVCNNMELTNDINFI